MAEVQRLRQCLSRRNIRLLNALAESRTLLDDRVEIERSENMTVYERILNMAKAHRFGRTVPCLGSM